MPLPNPREPLPRKATPALHQLFLEQALATPDAVAIEDESTSLSYRQLEQTSGELARRLAARGVNHQEVAVLLAHRSVAQPIGLLGILRAGAAFALLDPSDPPDRLGRMVAMLHPRALLSAAAAGPVPAAVRDEAAPSLRLEVQLPPALGSGAPGSGCAAEVEVNPDDTAYIAFSSGTTGQPKGIVGGQAALPHFFRWHIATFGFTARDRFALLSGLTHDPSLRDIFTPLLCGARLCIPDASAIRDPERLREFLNSRRVTVIHLTPSLGQILTHGLGGAAAPALPYLRYAFFAGEVLKGSTADRFRAAAPGAAMVNFYGATETPQAMGYHWVLDSEGADRDVIPVGRGIADVQLLVMPREAPAGAARLCSVGELGEVYIRTPYLAQCYLGDRERSRECFVVNPFTNDPADRLYRTGDLGRFTGDGEVEVSGRVDDQVKIRGHRVEPEEIEAVLARHGAVTSACVLALPSERGEPRLSAFVESAGQPTVAELRAFVEERLPEYMVPREFRILESLPMTSSGKVDRRALAALEPVVRSAALRPADPVVASLCRMFEQALETGHIGPGDDFFEHGGESLIALDLLAAVEEKFGVYLSLGTLLTATTPATLAPHVRQGASPKAGLLVTLQPGRPGRPPVYWLPGGGGLSVMAFRRLTGLLGADQPVYGLEADLDLARAPTTLEGLAASYCDAMREHQPAGPTTCSGSHWAASPPTRWPSSCGGRGRRWACSSCSIPRPSQTCRPRPGCGLPGRGCATKRDSCA